MTAPRDTQSTLTIEQIDGVVVAAGELDLAAAPQFQHAVEAMFPPGQPLVLDLSDVTYMDSSGIAALVWLWKRAGSTADAVTLRRPHPQVLHVLDLTHMTDVFRIDPHR
jgi:anti-anti-sigma factor